MKNKPLFAECVNPVFRSGSLTVIKSKNIGKPLKYGFFFVKFLFLYVVCVVIMI